LHETFSDCILMDYCNVRLNKSRRLRDKFPGYYPIIIVPSNESIIDKTKFLVNGEYTFSKFLCIIRNHMHIKESSGVFITIEGKMPILTDSIENSFKSYARSDEYLYISLHTENTFGAKYPQNY